MASGLHEFSLRLGKLGRKAEYTIIAVLTGLFFLLEISQIQEFSYQYFDEPTYLGVGKALVNLVLPPPTLVNPHPPLAQIILGVGVQLLGDNPIGWRLTVVLFATSMIPLIYFFGRKFFGTSLGGVLPATLLTFEFMHYVLGKLAILETIFVFFALLTQYAFYSYYKYAIEHNYGHSTKRMLFVAVTFGLSLASKWPAVFSLLGFAPVFLYLTWHRHQLSRGNREVWRKTTVRPLVVTLLCFVVVGAIYFSTFIPYYLGGWSWSYVLYQQILALKYQTTLKATFPWSSEWWSWPLILTPLPLQISVNSPTMIQQTSIMGNPAIWWLTYPALTVSLLAIAARRNGRLAYLTLNFLSSWLPFGLLSRFEIIYYYYVSVPLLILLITYWLLLAWRFKWGKLLVIIYLVTTLLLFIEFYPILAGIPISSPQAQSLEWLPGWSNIVPE